MQMKARKNKSYYKTQLKKSFLQDSHGASIQDYPEAIFPYSAFMRVGELIISLFVLNL